MGIKLDTGNLLRNIFSSVKRPNIPKLDVNGLLDKAFKMGGSAGGNNQFRSNMQNHRYRYRVDAWQVLIPGQEPIDMVPSAIQNIFLTQLYDEAIHPILEIKTLLPPRLHEAIVNHKNDVNIRFRLVAVDINNQNSGYHDIINDTFIVLIDDEAPFQESKLYDKTNEAQGGKGSGTSSGIKAEDKHWYNVSDYTESYEISLWRERDLIAMRKTVNEIYNDCTLSSALGHILGNAGIDKMLISPLNNDKQYPQVIIPPMNLMNVFEYLQQTYGTYYFGTMSFYDYRCLYILNKSGACDCYEQGEYRKTIITAIDNSNSSSKATGTFESPDEQEYVMYVDPENISVQTPSTTQDLIAGNNVTIVDSGNNETTEVSGAGKQRGMGNSTIVSDKFGNDFNKSVMLSEINERNLHLSCYLLDHDLFAMTPNKEFVVYFTDKEKGKYNGYYRLTSAVAAFTKAGGMFNCAGQYDFAFKSGLGSDEVQLLDAKVNPNIQIEQPKAKGPSNTPTPKETNDIYADGVHADLKKASDVPNPHDTDKHGNIQDNKYPDTFKKKSGDSEARNEYNQKVQDAHTPSKAPRPRSLK